MHPVLRPLLPPAAAWLAKAICATLRVQVIRGEIEPTVRARRRNVIYAFWHGHLLYLMYRYRDSGVYILVSQSRDGDVLSEYPPALRLANDSRLQFPRRPAKLAGVGAARAGWCECGHCPRWSAWTTSSSAIGRHHVGTVDRDANHSGGGRGAVEGRIPQLGSFSPAAARQSRHYRLWRASGGAVQCRCGGARAEATGAGVHTRQAQRRSDPGTALPQFLARWQRIGVRRIGEGLKAGKHTRNLASLRLMRHHDVPAL